MKNHFVSAALGRVCAAVGFALFAGAPIAHAQTVNAPVLINGDDGPGPQNAPVRSRTVAEVTNALTRGAGGAYVVSDGTVGRLPALLPGETTTPANIEKQITDLVANLPKGTTWAKLYLPAPANAKRGYNGDDVAAYAQAQSRLVGPVGAAPPVGMVEILGQKVPEAKAQDFIAGLNLKPVYLITNPRAASPSGFGLTMDASKWAAMSPDEQKAFTNQQAAMLAQMEPGARNQMMQQNMMIFGQFMQNATPEQRQSMVQSMMQMGGNIRVMQGGTPPPAP